MKRFLILIGMLFLSHGVVGQESVISNRGADTTTLPLQVPATVFVPGGSFKMGQGSLLDDSRPAHQVTLSPYWIGIHEVTQAEYVSVMGHGGMENYFPGCDSCPVERVSWYHVQEYLKKLSQRTGLTYRLPTEAEWEYAARGGPASKGYKYSGSDNPSQAGWIVGQSGSRTHPVCRKRPNELGLCDMTGNVFEWCSDYYDAGYYAISPPENPQGPPTGTYRVMRGGSWYYDSAGLRVTERGKGNPDCRYGFVGFRVCRSGD